MRALVFVDEDRTELEAMEIVDIGFDDDIYGNYGLYMIDMQDNCMYIVGVDKAECNKICDKVVLDGYADLRAYGAYLFSGDD